VKHVLQSDNGRDLSLQYNKRISKYVKSYIDDCGTLIVGDQLKYVEEIRSWVTDTTISRLLIKVYFVQWQINISYRQILAN